KMELPHVVDGGCFDGFAVAKEMKPGRIHEILTISGKKLAEHLPLVGVAPDFDVNVEFFCMHHELSCRGGGPAANAGKRRFREAVENDRSENGADFRSPFPVRLRENIPRSPQVLIRSAFQMRSPQSHAHCSPSVEVRRTFLANREVPLPED